MLSFLGVQNQIYDAVDIERASVPNKLENENFEEISNGDEKRKCGDNKIIFSRPKSSEYFTEPSVLICSKDICAVPWESILGIEVHIIRALCVLSLISTKFSSGQNRRQAPLTMAFTLGKSGRDHRTFERRRKLR